MDEIQKPKFVLDKIPELESLANKRVESLKLGLGTVTRIDFEKKVFYVKLDSNVMRKDANFCYPFVFEKGLMRVLD